MPKDNGKLTPQMEEYARLRAMGLTKAEAARRSYNTQGENASKLGWEVEEKQKVKDRIYELKMQRMDAFKLDAEEQIRKYHDLYQMALEKEDTRTAMAILERIDKIGGFEAAKKTESVSTKKVLVGDDEDISKVVDKFSGVLNKHSDSPKTEH